MKPGDIVELTFNNKKSHLLYCGQVNIASNSKRLFYSLDKHKQYGFKFTNYERMPDRLIKIYDVRKIKSKGPDKAIEFRSKWENYFKKL